MVRKRVPGGGRKPMGPYSGKGSMLTTRLTGETRRALEDGAVEKGVSISQYVEFILCQHFGLKTGVELKYERLRAGRGDFMKEPLNVRSDGKETLEVK